MPNPNMSHVEARRSASVRRGRNVALGLGGGRSLRNNSNGSARLASKRCLDDEGNHRDADRLCSTNRVGAESAAERGDPEFTRLLITIATF